MMCAYVFFSFDACTVIGQSAFILIGARCTMCFYVLFAVCQVLQQTSDQEMILYSDVKEQCHPVAQVMILSLCSQPVDSDDRRTEAAGDAG